MQNSNNYKDWQNVFKLYNASLDPQERSNALSGLSYSRTAWLLNLYLQELIKSDPIIKRQDFFTVLNAVSRNPSGRDLAWNFYRENWNVLVAK